MTYGTKIRKFRNIKGYSQEFVAKRLGISQNAYSKMENDQTNIKAETLEKIADILEIEKVKLLKDDLPKSFNIEQHNHDSASQGVTIQREFFSEEKIKLFQEIIDSQKQTIESQQITIILLQNQIKDT